MAGAPEGNQNAAKARQWAAAIERALERRGDPSIDPDVPFERTPRMKALDALAESFIAKLDLEKDLGFYKEFGDRLDGKAAQGVIVAGDLALAEAGEIRLLGRLLRSRCKISRKSWPCRSRNINWRQGKRELRIAGL